MTTTPPPAFAAGLEGVVAAQTRLSSVDGHVGELLIAGYPVETLAPAVSFEDVLYLLWNDRLPAPSELAGFRAALAERRTLPPLTLDLLRAVAAAGTPVMDALRMAASTVTVDIAEVAGPDGRPAEALALAARFPTIVAAYWRLRQGLAPLAPRLELGHAANYLYMLRGETPSPTHERALETYLNTVIDHGLNASTFTARVIVSTGSDLTSAVVGALGALKGPLHGGAPGPALDMVFEIGTPERAEPVMRAKLEQGERLMGFGHRVYKVRDPRAEVLAAAAQRLFDAGGDAQLYALVRHVEQTAVRLLEEYKPGRKLQTNVEFYTALLLHGLGLPVDLFTPTFAISRVGGWLAHGFEQQATGRLIRPQSVYVGERRSRLNGRRQANPKS
jgi:citrate synthase